MNPSVCQWILNYNTVNCVICEWQYKFPIVFQVELIHDFGSACSVRACVCLCQCVLDCRFLHAVLLKYLNKLIFCQL
jgi:hypothetical protein